MTAAREPEHPIETAFRAVTGALLTETVVFGLALGLALQLPGAVLGDSGWALATMHALGTGLDAAAALLVAERLGERGHTLWGLVAGLLISPLAPLGGWYLRDLAT